jgi:DNA mismatch repair protein MutS
MKTGAAPSDDDVLVQSARVSLPPGTKITPMLRQWLQAKAKAPDATLLFRMGDFYELFGDDARVAGDVLGLAVTTRDRDKGEDAMPMAGFPHPAAPGYIARLIAHGLKVAVCDQLEDPALAKGIVKRDVTRLVTPGMVLDDESLESDSNNFLVGVVSHAADADRDRFGLCALDISTGELFCTTADTETAIVDEVLRRSPRELVVDDALDAHLVERLVQTRPGQTARRVERRKAPARRRLVDRLGAPDRWLTERKVALLAAELVLGYAEETGQGKLPSHLRPPIGFSLDDRLLLDATTRGHLALCGPPGDLRREGTLLWHLDRTRTAAGGRRLLRRLLEPLAASTAIERRLDQVQALVDDPGLRKSLTDALSGMSDVERLVARVASGRAGPRELWRLGQGVARLPLVAAALLDVDAFAADVHANGAALEEAIATADVIARAIMDDAPAVIGETRSIREGYDAELDELWAASSGGKDRIAALEAREKEATGIASLKVRYNSVFGYYIEVTKTHQAKVPAHYVRKQTIATGERFTTEELTELQESVEGSQLRQRQREARLLDALLHEVEAKSRALLALCTFVADVDATLSLAEAAVADRAVRPLIVPREERRFFADELRHPVVERLCRARGEAFVPSSVVLDGDRQILLVTGPNMAGKSTLMRQVALCQLLAQIGTFVPATRVELSVCDRIFTRVGADDDAVTGRSTFMVEMTETSHILRGATPASLVLLDEIGRGTSTFDGVAIAWSVVEHLHDVVGARALFATHYHELTALEGPLARVKNVHVVVKEFGDDIIFVRALKDGPAGRSFGIQVARLAGLPPSVVARARAVLQHLEGDAPEESSTTAALPAALSKGAPRPRVRSVAAPPQLALFASTPPVAATSLPGDSASVAAVDALRARLAAIDIARLTPLQGLVLLDELVAEARRRPS